jgi:hypothetical protein
MIRFVSTAAACVAAWLTVGLVTAEDGKRAVDVPRFGVHVRVPQAWELVDWSRDDTAFVVDLPQDRNSPVGHVTCTITVAPESLEAYRKEFADEAARIGDAPATKTTPRSKLLKNEITPLASPPIDPALVKKLGRRLTAEWEFENVAGVRWYERRVLAMGDGMLYTFKFDSDESHYDAYDPEFEEMFAAARLDPLEIAVERLPQGYWMQRDFRFALKLPEAWRPAFGPRDRMLFYAVGSAHGLFTDHVVVQASPSKPLDLDRLKDEMPGEVKRVDATAEVTCKLVPQGRWNALETVIRTKRGATEVTIVERRFQTAERNYEVKLTCESGEFAKREAELRAMLDGFAEVPAEAKPAAT